MSTFNILTESDLMQLLKLSKRQAAGLMRTVGFPSFSIGNRYYVKAEKLDEYLDATKQTKIDYSST